MNSIKWKKNWGEKSIENIKCLKESLASIKYSTNASYQRKKKGNWVSEKNDFIRCSFEPTPIW